MKMYCLFFIIMLLSNALNAQDSRKNSLKINSIHLISNIYDLQYERVIQERSSVEFGLGIGKTNDYSVDHFQQIYSDFFGHTLNDPRDTHHEKEIFSLNLGYRHYTAHHKAPKGFYVGPAVQYVKFKERLAALEPYRSSSDSDTNGYIVHKKTRELDLLNVQALLGYQFLIANRFLINPYAGPSFVFGDTDETFEREDENLTGFGLNFGMAVGLTF